MGFFDRLLPWRRKDSTTSINPSSWFIDWIHGGDPTLSGIGVTPESAMRLAAGGACVRVRAVDPAEVPCLLYRRLPGGGNEPGAEPAALKPVKVAPKPGN